MIFLQLQMDCIITLIFPTQHVVALFPGLIILQFPCGEAQTEYRSIHEEGPHDEL